MLSKLTAHRDRKDKVFILLTLLPALVAVLFCCFIPVFQSIYMSFFNYMLSNVGNYVWNNFQNYKEIFTEGELYPAVKVTLIYVFWVVLLQLGMGLDCKPARSITIINGNCFQSEATITLGSASCIEPSQEIGFSRICN